MAHAHQTTAGAPCAGIVADDLTGAADAGMGFHRAGFATGVTWASAAFGNGDVPAVVSVDTCSRTTDVQAAMAVTADVVERLRGLRASLILKKIDSLMRGHVGAETVAALQAWAPEGIALVAPAFPRLGRTTVGGCQRVRGAPLAAGDVVAALDAVGLSANHVDLDTLRDNQARRLVAKAREAGVQALVFDAESDQDLAAIVEAGWVLGSDALWVGTAGLAAAVAARMAVPALQPARTLPPVAGPILIVVGSQTPMSRDQALHLAAIGVAHVPMPIAALATAGSTFAHQSAAAVRRHLLDGRDVVLTLAGATTTNGSEHHAQVTMLGDVLRPCASIASGLVLTGGETAEAVLRSSGVERMSIVSEVEDGVPILVAHGAHAVPVVTKAGAFGTVTTLARARARLRSGMTGVRPDA